MWRIKLFQLYLSFEHGFRSFMQREGKGSGSPAKLMHTKLSATLKNVDLLKNKANSNFIKFI